MKLSLKKRFGWIHVRGGELLYVVDSHRVMTSTASQMQKEFARPQPETDGEWVFCDVGDLAMEIVAVKTGALLGFSYLSGRAIQLNNYTTTDRGRFSPAKLAPAVIPVPREGDKPEEFFERFVGAILEIKYGKEVDVAAFRAKADSLDSAKGFVEHLSHAWSYCPVDEKSELVASGHLLGLVDVAGRKGGGVLAHFQPPKHATDLCASQFQCGLVISAAERMEGWNAQ